MGGRGSRVERCDVRASAVAAGRQHGSRLKRRKWLLKTLLACCVAALMPEDTRCIVQGVVLAGVDGSCTRLAAESRTSSRALNGRRAARTRQVLAEWGGVTAGQCHIVGLLSCSRAVAVCDTRKERGKGAGCFGLIAAGWKLQRKGPGTQCQCGQWGELRVRA